MVASRNSVIEVPTLEKTSSVALRLCMLVKVVEVSSCLFRGSVLGWFFDEEQEEGFKLWEL